MNAILASISPMAVRGPTIILGQRLGLRSAARAQHCSCRALLYFRTRID